MDTISRRGFLAAGAVGAITIGAGGFGAATKQADAAFVRPPGVESNARLAAACNRCQRCLQACPYGIITPVPLSGGFVAYGTPTLAFEQAHCDFCMKCVEACPTGALAFGGARERDLGVAVVVKDACVAWDWSGCTVCKDECPVEGAISLDDHDRPGSARRSLRRLREVRDVMPVFVAACLQPQHRKQGNRGGLTRERGCARIGRGGRRGAYLLAHDCRSRSIAPAFARHAPRWSGRFLEASFRRGEGGHP